MTTTTRIGSLCGLTFLSRLLISVNNKRQIRRFSLVNKPIGYPFFDDYCEMIEAKKRQQISQHTNLISSVVAIGLVKK